GDARLGPAVLGGGLNVGLHDPPTRARALELRKLNAQIARHPSRDRRSLHTPVTVPGRSLLTSSRPGTRLGLTTAALGAGNSRLLALSGGRVLVAFVLGSPIV